MNARLHIQAAWKNNKTFLKQVYQEPPFKVADITEDPKDKTLQLMLMNASPGVLDGDRYHICLQLEEGSRLQLHTQQYQRLFTMKTSALQQMEVHLQSGASLCYLPHPVVPHKAADFTAVNKIFLSDHCSLMWADILTCGRKGSGEEFLFSRYHSLTEILHRGKLVVKENLRMMPAVIPVRATGQMEGFTHQASFIYWKENGCTPALVKSLHLLLSAEQGICAGVSSVCDHALVIRLLGYRAEQVYKLVKKAAAFIAANADEYMEAKYSGVR